MSVYVCVRKGGVCVYVPAHARVNASTCYLELCGNTSINKLTNSYVED